MADSFLVWWRWRRVFTWLLSVPAFSCSGQLSALLWKNLSFTRQVGIITYSRTTSCLTALSLGLLSAVLVSAPEMTAVGLLPASRGRRAPGPAVVTPLPWRQQVLTSRQRPARRRTIWLVFLVSISDRRRNGWDQSARLNKWTHLFSRSEIGYISHVCCCCWLLLVHLCQNG